MISAWFKQLAAPLAAIAVFALAPGWGRADTVAFHTVATFTAAGTSVPGGGGVIGGLGTTLTYGSDLLTISGSSYGTGGANPDVPLVGSPGVNVSLGQIQMTGGASLQQFNGARVQFDVYQDYTTPPTNPPGPGQSLPPGTFRGSASGTLFAVGDRFDSLNLVFDAPFSFILPDPQTNQQESVVYTISPSQQTTASSNGLLDVSVNVSAAPLPATATTGLSLLAGCGCAMGVAAVRRRRMASAV